MLMEIRSDAFVSFGKQREPIRFHTGLNTVLGTESGTNSIGKSTMLMIIDFVFGGDDYVKKLDDVQRNVGPHKIYFTFRFGEKYFYFYRSTVDFENVYICNSQYELKREKPLSIDIYREFLARNYHIDHDDLSLRDGVGLFMRIYGRENLNESRPLDIVHRASGKDSITRLLKLTGVYSSTAPAKQQYEEAKDKSETFEKAKKYSYISIANSKDACLKNEKRILEIQSEMRSLVEKTEDGVIDIDSALQSLISQHKQNLTVWNRQKALLIRQLNNLKSDRKLGKGRFTSDFSALLRFFPEANLQRLEAVENFHNQLKNVLDKEFKETEKKIENELASVQSEIDYAENSIKEIGKTKNLSETVMMKYTSLEEERKSLQIANENFELSSKFKAEANAYKEAYEQQIESQITHVEGQLNSKMKEYNDFIYDGKRTSPVLKIISSDKYSFSTYNDGGTGSKYKGMVVFDLAMLDITELPVLVHDSVILKNIQDTALERILELYQSTEKQVFIALDKAGAYTEKAQTILENTTVIRLYPGDGALFGKTWNEENLDD